MVAVHRVSWSIDGDGEDQARLVMYLFLPRR